MGWMMFVPIMILLGLGVLVDLKRKKRNDYLHKATNPDAKPGDSTNYKMGDNNYTSGGE